MSVACNSKGRLTSVASSASITNLLCYDSMGRVIQSSQTTGSYTYPFSNYTYNLAGHLVSQTLPSGKVIGTNIDEAGRVAGVYRQGGSYYAGAAETNNRPLTHSCLAAPKRTKPQAGSPRGCSRRFARVFGRSFVVQPASSRV